MRITDGNIFEGMRLVLPEHREVMEKMWAERKRRRPPELSEDELSEMQYTLSEAMEEQRPVRVTLFHPSEDVTLEGLISVRGNMLWIQTQNGPAQLSVKDIIGIELI